MNPLAVLLSLSDAEKERRGLLNTPREIFQQPETWLETIDRLAQLRPGLAEFIAEFLQEKATRRPAVILAGAGTSDYVGRVVSRTLRRQWGCEVTAVPSTELLTNLDDFILPACRYLFISFSRSGESSEGVAVLELARMRYPSQVNHLVVTCNQSGAMAKMAGVCPLVLGARTNDRGLAMTSSFTNMVLAGLYLAFVQAPEQFEPLAKKVAEVAANKMADIAEAATGLARRGFSRVCFLGAGPLQAVAEESALKVLELNAGRIATVAQSPLGLRHGPLAFVDDQTLVVAYLSGEEQRQRYELDLLDELAQKGLGAETLIVAPRAIARLVPSTAKLLVLDAPKNLPDFCLSLVHVIVGQLLGLFFSIENGITPDSPSSGAISRVVSHVRIYPFDGGAQ